MLPNMQCRIAMIKHIRVVFCLLVVKPFNIHELTSVGQPFCMVLFFSKSRLTEVEFPSHCAVVESVEDYKYDHTGWVPELWICVSWIFSADQVLGKLVSLSKAKGSTKTSLTGKQG